MQTRHRQLTLTPAHIERIHKVIEDGGPTPGVPQQTDADYADWVARILDRHSDPGAPTRLFAYGSLIWKPEIQHVGECDGVAHGWHRSFCLKIPRFRGTPQQPGLMMALDRGGRCRGVLYELPPAHLDRQLDRLFRREFTFKPTANMPRWVRVRTAAGAGHALTFVASRSAPIYAGRLPPDAVAEVLATACGHLGTGAEYLLNTVTHLEARGIHDAGLWRLQRLVAERIDRL